MPDKAKSLVSRNALERVLARAAELQGASGEEMEAAETLTEDQILELGREVGLSVQHLRQALAEERARIEPSIAGDEGLAASLFGGSRVAAQRVVPGSPAKVLSVLDHWMEREEWLRVVRQRADRRIWEPRRDIFGSIRRALAGRGASLSRADSISATVVDVDEGHTLVRLEADFQQLRGSQAGRTVGGILAGGAVTGALLFMNVLVPVAIAPAVAITGATYAMSRRSQKQALERAHLTLEQVLDRLERGDRQAPGGGLLRMIEAALPPTR